MQQCFDLRFHGITPADSQCGDQGGLTNPMLPPEPEACQDGKDQLAGPAWLDTEIALAAPFSAGEIAAPEDKASLVCLAE